MTYFTRFRDKKNEKSPIGRSLENSFTFLAVGLQFFNKTTDSQTPFGFTKMGSKMHSFRVIVCKKGNFDLCHPVFVASWFLTHFQMLHTHSVKI